MPDKKITIGIRNSNLSKAQTNQLIQALIEATPNLNEDDIQIEFIQTTGDKNPTHRLDQIGGKGLFIKEIEEHIIKGTVDLGVHSLKDLPATAELSELELICWMRRQSPQDSLLSNSGKTFSELPAGSIIGTSSIRRRAQILSLRPDLSIKLLRGNVDTRVNKLHNKEYDAILLSIAGLERLGLDDLVTETLPLDLFLPAACQGTVAVQAKQNSPLKDVLMNINDEATQLESTAERLVLKTINANCNSPVSVYGKINADKITIDCVLYSHNGEKLFAQSVTDDKVNFKQLSVTLGENIISAVGQEHINALDNLEDDFDYTPS